MFPNTKASLLLFPHARVKTKTLWVSVLCDITKGTRTNRDSFVFGHDNSLASFPAVDWMEANTGAQWADYPSLGLGQAWEVGEEGGATWERFKMLSGSNRRRTADSDTLAGGGTRNARLLI